MSYWLMPFLDILYRGKNFTDPVNGRSYRKFLSYGYGKTRKNVLSPGTFSLERHRFMWLYLQRYTNFFEVPLKVLHIAPEQCFLKRFQSQKNLDYTTCDLYSPIADVKADIRQLPFDDNSFDVIFCNHVLEHIPEDILAMKELFRVLKPEGWGIIQVPMRFSLEKTYEDFSIIHPEERKKHFGQYDHVRWYGWDFFERLASVGFECKKIIAKDLLTEKERKLFSIPSNELIPFVKKSLRMHSYN